MSTKPWATPNRPALIADESTIATGGADAEAYESVLVRVENVDVTDPNPDAPDNSISDRPGGPNQSGGAQKKNGGKGSPGNSGGITPPPPSPAVP